MCKGYLSERKSGVLGIIIKFEHGGLCEIGSGMEMKLHFEIENAHDNALKTKETSTLDSAAYAAMGRAYNHQKQEWYKPA